MIHQYKNTKFFLILFSLCFCLMTGYSSETSDDDYSYLVTSAQSQEIFPPNRHNKINPEDIDQGFYTGQIRSIDTNDCFGSGCLISAELIKNKLRVTGISALHNFISYNIQAKQLNCYKCTIFIQGSIVSQDNTLTEYATINVDKVWALNPDCPMKDICLFEGYVTKLNENLWKTNQNYLETFNLKAPIKSISEGDIVKETARAEMHHFIVTALFQRISQGRLNGSRTCVLSTMKGSAGAAIFVKGKIVGIHQGTFKDDIEPNKIVRHEGSNIVSHISTQNCFEKFSLTDLKNLKKGVDIFTKKSTWPQGFKGKLVACLIDDFVERERFAACIPDEILNTLPKFNGQYFPKKIEGRFWTDSVTGQKILLE